MPGNAPAATRALAALRALATAPAPMTATTLARQLGVPRSSTYHLLAAMRDAGFVTHYPEAERWGLGVAAFEVGAAYLRHDPLERMAEPLLRRLVREAQRSSAVVAHLGILLGCDTLYLLKERSAAPVSVVTEVGVRLPAALTASGRAILMALPAAQVRAAFSGRDAFVDRTGAGPRSMSALTALLAEERRRGYCEEDGFISEGFASVAVAARDHLGRPVAAVGLTFRGADVPPDRRQRLARAAARCAEDLSGRLGAHAGASR